MEVILKCWSDQGNHFVETDRRLYQLFPDPIGEIPFTIEVLEEDSEYAESEEN